MTEKSLVNRFVHALTPGAAIIKTEVSNFHRSADIVILHDNGEVWIVECKLSAIGRAVNQLKTHKLSADRVYIGLPKGRRTNKSLQTLSEHGFGLLEIDGEGKIDEVIQASSNVLQTQHFKNVLISNMDIV